MTLAAISNDALAKLATRLNDLDVAPPFGYLEAARVAVIHLTPGHDVARELQGSGIIPSSAARMARAATEVLGPPPPDESHTVRRALADAVHYLEHPDQAIPANRVRQLRQVAGVQLVEAGTGFDKGMAGSARAAAKWTDEEVALVDKAIRTVATKAAAKEFPEGSRPAGHGYAPDYDRDAVVQTFTADDVWTELGPGFLVTKGLAGRLAAAANRDVIRNAGVTVISTRDGEHGHGQRLTVWVPGQGLS